MMHMFMMWLQQMGVTPPMMNMPPMNMPPK